MTLVEQALAELERRTVVRGSRKRLAHILRTDTSRLCEYLTGRRAISENMAERILYRLHVEELRLADKIEAEMHVPWRVQ